MRPDTDRDLLQRWRQGDETAFAKLLTRHQAMVVGVARRVIGEHHAAEDVGQAVFLILARKAATLASGGADLGGWLHRVARDLARNRRAADVARRRNEGVAVSDIPLAEPVVDAVLRGEFQQQLDDALASLPERQRASVVLHHLEDLPVPMVAARLGAPEGSVCQWLSRGRERLRRALERRGVAVGVALPLLLADAIASPGPAAPFAPSAAAKHLAASYVQQKAVVSISIGLACAAAAILATVLVVAHPKEESPMPSHPLTEVAIAATLAAAPMMPAAENPAAVELKPIPAAAAPVAVRSLVRGDVATLGEAARALSGEWTIQVEQSLQNLPILWPAEGRFTGTPAEIMKRIVFFPGQPPMSFGGSNTSAPGQATARTLHIRSHAPKPDGAAAVPPASF